MATLLEALLGSTETNGRCRRPALNIVLILSVVFVAVGCRHFGKRSKSSLQDTVEDAAAPIEAVATVTDGVLVSRAGNQEQWLPEIQAQLQYAAGAISGWGAVADLSRIELDVDVQGVTVSGKEWRVPYVARFALTAPRAALSLRTVVLPRRGDIAGQDDFFRLYGASCRASGAKSEARTFWHVFRPEAKGCPLGQPPFDRQNAVRAALDLTATKPEGMPDYDRFRSEKNLVVTMVVDDARLLNDAVRLMTERFGAPASLSASMATFSKPLGADATKGQVDLAVLGTGAEARTAFRERTKRSGVVAYLSTGSLSDAGTQVSRWLDFTQDPGGRALAVLVSGLAPFPFVPRDIAEGIAAGDGFVVATSPGRQGSSAATLLNWLDLMQGSVRSYAEIAAELGRDGRVLVRPAASKEEPSVAVRRSGAVLVRSISKSKH